MWVSNQLPFNLQLIINVFKEMSVPIRRFGPRVDVDRRQPFLPGRPLDLIQKGIINQVPLIIGVNQNESALFLACKYSH